MSNTEVFNTNKLLKDWEIIEIARHPLRPYFLDLLPLIFNDFQELHGDRISYDDKAIIGGIGKFNFQPVMIIGQEKGRKINNKIKHNFGMMHPEGYRKALRLMKLAEKFSIPIINFIDTPGADPGMTSEKRGQSKAIASNLLEMSTLKVPIIGIIIGEGCSGGALGIGISDKLVMLEYSYFSVISPEGCASILWKNIKKYKEAVSMMKITAKSLKQYNIIDEIIEEPLGGAHLDIHHTANNIKHILTTLLFDLQTLSVQEICKNRYNKIRSYGIFQFK